MEDNLIALLEIYKYPVRRQGSFAPSEAYPDTFITFWNNSEVEESAYDDQTASSVYDYSVNVYSTDPSIPFTLLRQIRADLRANGWTASDRGHDVMSDEMSHVGRGIDVEYLNFEKISIGGNNNG